MMSISIAPLTRFQYLLLLKLPIIEARSSRLGDPSLVGIRYSSCINDHDSTQV